MPVAASPQELLAALKREASALGLAVRETDGPSLAGEIESIGAKWWLGGRAVSYRMACRLDEAARTARFREAVMERSWGIPPPTFTVEKTTVSGWKRSGQRKEVSLGGGGSLDYARVREAIEHTVRGAGWTFHFEGGRMP